mmetsp:Transcript_13605/g.26141  ORF Transcript_13605/g.26141 Transcript_13605/m.26141 type:complete len:275 (-) Transcript_13605:86-910(-)|eukprot:CAMPEP_0114236954 /NCGR_PEP_ID=MMETSP0058-20121206/7128_1 /TAXON_ID=36894 /ORGANISM="Pyramimonas parkeae, CCMP726" /LENGTH=274 /DNA_ID=CAMNT_0001348955 /DNA_START=290 /DNA_END=1114 /DNA_ORIENTATION=-
MELRIEKFDFIPGLTPLSSWRAPVAAVCTYLIVLVAARLVVVWRGSFRDVLKPVVLVHNAFLSGLSAVLLMALCLELYWEYASAGYGMSGMWAVWCDPPPRLFTKGRLYAIYYANYLVKFYEMLDTVIMVLRNNPVPFLHVYHHSATLVLCWSQLHAHSTTMWVPISLNLLVHVFMYFYYAVATLGVKVWWKRHLTTMQIVQFIIDVGVCAWATALKYGHDTGMSWGVDCGGTTLAGYFGTGLLLSYLVLFINFYIFNYVFKRVHGKPRLKKDA